MKIPLSPPPLRELLDKVLAAQGADDFMRIMEAGADELSKDRYRHWDTVRHIKPPDGLSTEEWWVGIRMARSPRRYIPLRSIDGDRFGYVLTDLMQRNLHEIDQEASGRIQVSEQVTDPEVRDRYVISSLIEESVTSSQLEGASTTMQVAKEMIRIGRRPVDRSEQMILNNYRAMRWISELRDQPLTTELVLHLHDQVTRGTLDDPDGSGRFRRKDEPVQVADDTGQVLHQPPDARELPQRMKAMCSFANDDGRRGPFVHPVLRAISLHFWLAYDHPFIDGNGRTARALFYWSMLRQDYWLAEFLSISSILKAAPAKYARSFLYTETDECDLTYFLLYHLEVLRRSIGALHDYLERKMEEARRVTSVVKDSERFNHRQTALLGHALRHPGHRYTIKSHQSSHGIVYQTARSDLLALADSGLLEKRKRRQAYLFISPDDLSDRIEGLGRKRRTRRKRA